MRHKWDAFEARVVKEVVLGLWPAASFRGVGIVDGSILITGDGAGNTTLGYFGASDGDTDPGAMPEGGFGRLNLRYNPYRALPDGINLPVLFEPVAATYTEN